MFAPIIQVSSPEMCVPLVLMSFHILVYFSFQTGQSYSAASGQKHSVEFQIFY